MASLWQDPRYTFRLLRLSPGFTIVAVLSLALVVGAGLALASAQVAKSLLFGSKPRDPLTLARAFAILSTVAALASFRPAYRASKLDPMLALRE